MPVHKCSNGKYKIGSGPCMYVSEEKAYKAYKAYLAQKHDNDEEIIEETNNFNLLFVDAIELSNILQRSRSLSLSKFSTLIKTIKTRIGLKVPHMGILPHKMFLPMKNLNRLQTKMEKLVTQEQKWLTSEQYEQRKQYAKYMRKRDAEETYNESLGKMSDEEFTDNINTLYKEIIDYFPYDEPEDAIDKAFGSPTGDNAWILSNEAQIISINDGLNNIIKAPIILAKEMVQSYTNENGELEYHFKPYSELELAVERVGKDGSLDMIIEHQDWYSENKIMGYVKNIRADAKERCIRGMGYFHESKLPEGLKEMIKDGQIIPVSIGFLAKLGGRGSWQGQVYEHTQKNIVLRHLAICLESVARCPAGVCGINLKDAENVENEDKVKTFIIINKDNYYYNICNIKKDIIDSKKETNKEIINKNSEKEEEIMQEDSNVPKNQAADFEVILSKLQAHIQNESPDLRKQIIKKILAALGIKSKSDSEMEEKEYTDAIAKKDSEIKALSSKLEDATEVIKKFEEEKRKNLISEIKKFGDKYSDEELEIKDLEILKEIADAVSRFAPSDESPDKLPVAPKDDKKKMEDELGKTERIDFSKVFEDVNKEFNMG